MQWYDILPEAVTDLLLFVVIDHVHLMEIFAKLLARHDEHQAK